MQKQKNKKLDKFLEALFNVEPAYGKDIGIIVCEDNKTASEVLSSFPDSNTTATFNIQKEKFSQEVLNDLADVLESEEKAILRLHGYLPPKLYNQLRLISKSARIQYFQPEKDITLDLPKDSHLVVVTTKEELNNLNYNDIFNFGPVLNI